MSIDLAGRERELVSMKERILSAAHDLVEGDMQPGELNTAAGDQHIADHASDMMDRELDVTLEDHAEELVREIDDALARIVAGTYGLCVSCHGQIPEERLDAVPYASLCIECKRREEHG